MTATSIPVIVFLIVPLIAIVAWYNVIRLNRARQGLHRWLRARGFDLVSARLCWWPSGPFSLAIARHQPVYRVLARDRSGTLCRGWVCCANFSDEAEAAWE
ncbi:MAG: hypothetical protein ABSH53_05420 [Holophaga sp.]|jgi:hypothetical protein